MAAKDSNIYTFAFLFHSTSNTETSHITGKSSAAYEKFADWKIFGKITNQVERSIRSFQFQ